MRLLGRGYLTDRLADQNRPRRQARRPPVQSASCSNSVTRRPTRHPRASAPRFGYLDRGVCSRFRRRLSRPQSDGRFFRPDGLLVAAAGIAFFRKSGGGCGVQTGNGQRHYHFITVFSRLKYQISKIYTGWLASQPELCVAEPPRDHERAGAARNYTASLSNSAVTASPICSQDTSLMPSCMMSPVRSPESSTLRTACSTRSASSPMSNE